MLELWIELIGLIGSFEFEDGLESGVEGCVVVVFLEEVFLCFVEFFFV